MSHRQIPCRSCGQYIVFLPTASGKQMPIDVDSVDEQDTEYDSKKHISHFSTCPEADKFRSRK